jgi:hypothetical protein
MCSLVLLALAGCGGAEANTTDGPATTAATSTPAQSTDGTTTNGATAEATATISGDGLLFVGTDRAKVGDTIKVSIVNEEAGPVDVTLLDPAGKPAGQMQVSGGATAQISAIATDPGRWTVRFHDGTGDLTKEITVS